MDHWSCGHCHRHLEKPAVKPPLQPTPRRICLSPWQFSSREGQDSHSRTGFCPGTTHRVHTPTSVQEALTAKGFMMIPLSPHLPDIAPADIFLFPRRKSELPVLSLTQDSFRTSWIRGHMDHCQWWVCHWWYYRCDKCVQISDVFLEKSWEISAFLTLIIVFLLNNSSFILFSPRISSSGKLSC